MLAGTPTFGPNQLPDLPGWREAYSAYRTAGIEAVLRMYRALSMALGLDPYWLESQPGETMYQLRMIHYPPQDRVTPEPGQLGCGAHTDYGTLTLLRQDDAPGGLEVRGTDGAWHAVPAVDGAFVVNVGDALERWSNDRWRSTLHRVVVPPADAGRGTQRQSTAFFHNANWDAVIEPIGENPKYAPITAGQHLMSKFRATQY